MAKYLKVKGVKDLIKSRGKRSTSGYIEYLDRRIEKIVLDQIHRLGSIKTLEAQDAVAYWIKS